MNTPVGYQHLHTYDNLISIFSVMYNVFLTDYPT